MNTINETQYNTVIEFLIQIKTLGVSDLDPIVKQLMRVRDYYELQQGHKAVLEAHAYLKEEGLLDDND